MVKEHFLFKEALKLYPKSSEQYRVCTLTLLFHHLRRFPLTCLLVRAGAVISYI